MATRRPTFSLGLDRALLAVAIVLNLVVLGLLLNWGQPNDRQATQSLEPRASQRTFDPTTAPAPSSTAEPSGTPSAGPATPSDTARSGEQSIALRASSRESGPFEPVAMTGAISGGEPLASSLEVQRFENGSWVSFPLPAAVDYAGRFQTFVELGSTGRHQLRVVDPETQVASNVITVTIS